MSASQVFASVARANSAHLLEYPATLARERPSRHRVGALPRPNRNNLKEFLIYGVKYVFPVEHGGETRGIPTAEAAPPLKEYFPQDFALPPVWPHPEGTVRGLEFSPISRNVPHAVLLDPKLYELLALVDAIREGRAREREIAVRELTERIDSK
ncbi:MAG: hypothetical protein WBX38_22685 [Candidatus Sulfotelmatobacter sp.]